MNDQLTIIVPVYNEAPCLNYFRGEMDKFMAQTAMDTTVLFVNDGSTDKSQKIIEHICTHNKRYKFIVLDANSGLSTAIKAGIDACETSLVGYIDADIQTSPLDFLHLLEFFPVYDLVNGIRVKRKDAMIKKISSRIANTFRKMIIQDDIEDTCCPLKLVKIAYARKIPFFDGMHRFIPALVKLEGGRVKQVPVGHFPRVAGTAKYHLRNRLIGPFIDTMVFLWIKRRQISYRIIDHSI